MKLRLPRTVSTLPTALLFFVSLAAGQDIRRPPTDRDRVLSARMGWAEAARAIGGALGSAYQPGRSGLAGSSGNESFREWLDLYQWAELLSRQEAGELSRFLGCFLFLDADSSRPLCIGPGQLPPQEAWPVQPGAVRSLVEKSAIPRTLLRHVLPADYLPRRGSIADSLDPEFLTAMACDADFLEAFFLQLSTRDFTPGVLRRLQDIWRSHPRAWPDYRNLAIAIAVVGDQRPPSWWPHSQVRREDVPFDASSASKTFGFWVRSNESGLLLTDLRRMSAGELKFVVDAPVALSEFAWAQSHIRYPRADFGRAFRLVSYRKDRLENGEFNWSEGSYTLEAISLRGGICVDQAYFAMLAGKARGLPTLYFTGQGNAGGHAWFGYLKAERRWDMDCGRYENQNYAVGEALDPQTWLPINDHELLALADSFRLAPQYLASRADLAVAQIFERAGDLASVAAALESAIAVCPKNQLAWAAKGRFLERQEAALRERRAFHEAALKEFVNNLDIKVSHQRALASLARDSGDEEAARKLESGIIGQNRLGRFDLSVSTAAAQLKVLLDAGRTEDALQDYRRLLPRLGRSAGGDFFYGIVEPFATAASAGGDPANALRAVELARRALRPGAGSVLDQDLRRLAKRIREGG